jgi:hypothetical protein
MISNEQIILNILNWQTCGYIHPLTCRKQSSHTILFPILEDDRVKLKCVDCGFVQDPIPEYFTREVMSFSNPLEELLKNGNEKESN